MKQLSSMPKKLWLRSFYLFILCSCSWYFLSHIHALSTELNIKWLPFVVS
uniref:Uncharacterized protein n=1 Tax=Aegilops tauschii subsp. strangulata TaxID=200361 RepID=A0A453L6X5_AEGTS